MATKVEQPKVTPVEDDKVQSKEDTAPATTQVEAKESQETAPQTQEAPITIVDDDDEEEEVEYSDEEEEIGEDEADFDDDDDEEFGESDDGYESGDDAGNGKAKRSALAQLYDDDANLDEEDEDEEYVEDGEITPAAGSKRPVSAVEEAEGEVEELPKKKAKTAEE